MDRSDRGHMNEALNLRSFYLRLVKKIWIIPVAAVITALLAVGIYTLVTVTFGPAKTYSTETKLYIKFHYDEKSGTMVDHYNAYTWSLLISADDVMNTIVDELEKRGVSVTDDASKDMTITRDELIASVKAEIPSDVRLLLVTVQNSDREMTDIITASAAAALEHYGDTNDAFDSISTISMSDAKLVTYSDRSAVTAVFGFAVGAVVCILVLLLLDALDDAVYVPEDAENRYGIPVLGTTFEGEKAQGDAFEFFKNELKGSFEKVISGAGHVVFVSVDSIKDETLSESDLGTFKNSLGAVFEDGGVKAEAIAVPGTVLDNYRKIGTTDGVILAIPAGKKNATLTDHIIAQLRKHDCPILGIVLTRADFKFLKTYYRLK